MFACNIFAFFRFSLIFLLLLIRFGHCVKTNAKSESSSPLTNNGQQQQSASSGIPYHSPTKFAQGLRKNESRYTKLYQVYSDKIGSTSNPHRQAMYDSAAEKSFLRSRKSAEKAEKMEKVAKTLQIDSNFSVKNQPRTRLQAKKLEESQHHTNGNPGA